MVLRIEFDRDGVLADFSTAFREAELRLFGRSSTVSPESPEVEAHQEEDAAGRAVPDGTTPRDMRRRRDAVWKAIHDTPDFWTSLKPHDPGAVLRISRGAAAGALRLNYHVDDSPRNCLDVATDSRAQPILIVSEPDAITGSSAKRLRIGVARSIGEPLDSLEHMPAGGSSSSPRLLGKLYSIWDRTDASRHV